MTPSSDNKNMILTIVLSAIVFIGWQYFYAGPQLQKQREAQHQAELAKANQPAPQNPATLQPGVQQAGVPVGAPPPIDPAGAITEREPALALSPRVKIETPRLSGSIALRGAVLDDLSLKDYKETVDPASPTIVLFSPEATKEPYYAYFGWLGQAGVKTPDMKSLWVADGTSLGPDKPLTLRFDNGAGLVFKRIYSIDRNYEFTDRGQRREQDRRTGDAHPLRLDQPHRHPYARRLCRAVRRPARRDG